MFYHKQFSALL